MENIENAVKTLQSEIDSLQKQLAAREQALIEKEKKFENEKLEMSKRYKIEDSVIELNVGGTHFTTLRSTLCKYEHSFLEAMFSGRHPSHKDSSGRYVIDRDGQCFSYILNFLRSEQLILPDSESQRKQLQLDIEYYGLTKYISSLNFVGTTLLTSAHIDQLHTWYGSKKTWKLLYKATVDGFGSDQFHQKCNNKGETITVVQSLNGNLFGGYAPQSWTSRGGYYFDNRAWIFSLTYSQKMTNTGPSHSNTYSIYDASGYGPTFGGGHDFEIANASNKNRNSYSNLGHSYLEPTGNGYNSTQAKNYLAGSHNFQVKEIEVFGI
jgi:hypothetical protein